MKKIIPILAILVFTGCSHKNRVPKGVLSLQEMTAIMWDMMRADEYINIISNYNDTLGSKERVSMYEQIFRLHSTNQSVFKKSISFYQSRPDLFKVISDSLRSTEKKVYEDQNRVPTPVLDSINKKLEVQ
jgi:Domain of unknown function (DUF4296)